ncbi:MAG: glycerol-3-phosphate dehydrogenase [Rhodocyclales bacterium GWA2_65_19]|nr:MAG: glycerol-3-phosphate dehydrogenase [Rhodocyclales bacterium GWA2_65_19]
MTTPGREFDLLVIGGGINGAGVARDAAGRGVRTALVDQGDFGGATSSASTKLIHGGLRYLEHFEFRLVAESLAEREVILRLAPHLVSPLRFVMPQVPALRPVWMIRLGLWLYDRMGGRSSLPGSATVRLLSDGYGAGLKPELTKGFSYSDARVDDARLVILNLKSARDHGATLLPRTRLVAAARDSGRWRATLECVASGQRFESSARVLINAAGPWVKHVTDCTGSAVSARVRLVKGSHIVVPRAYAGDHAYILQNADQRVVFMIPYEEAYTLIGTTDAVIDSLDQARSITREETCYLLAAVNRYLQCPLAESDVVWSYAGVRPLYDDGQGDPAAITRDYQLLVDDRDGAVQLSIFGGKLTTYRKLAETVLARLAPWLDYRRAAWTHGEPLPGGEFDPARRDAELQRLCAAYPQLPQPLLRDLFARHGLILATVLGEARTLGDLGRDFGGGLYRREAEYFVAREWALAADDILWRRSKAGLRMTAAQREDFTTWFASFRAAAS